MKSDIKKKTTMFWEGDRNSVHFFSNTPTLHNAASLLLNSRTSAVVIFSFSNLNNSLDIALVAHNKKDTVKYSEILKQIIPTIEKLLEDSTTNSNGKETGIER